MGLLRVGRPSVLRPLKTGAKHSLLPTALMASHSCDDLSTRATVSRLTRLEEVAARLTESAALLENCCGTAHLDMVILRARLSRSAARGCFNA